MIKRVLALPDDNVIFQREIAGVRWIGSVSGVGRYALIALAIVGGVVLLAVGAVVVLLRVYEDDVSSVVMLPLNLMSSFGNLRGVFELAAVFYGVGLISNERTAGRLDLIRMAIGEQAFVEAKHALTVVRTWRIAAFYVIGQMLGVLGVALLGLLTLFDPEWQAYYGVDLSGFGWLLLLIGTPIVLGAAVIAALVPIWQMRALAALSVNISARTENRGGAIALGIVGWVLINTVLGVIYIALYLPWIVGFIGFVATEPDVSEQTLLTLGLLGGSVVLPLYALLVVFVIYHFYRVVRRRLLRNTVHLLVTSA